MQKGFAPILILVGILVVGLIAGGAYYLGKSQVSKPQTQNPVVFSQTPLSTPMPSSIQDETADWKPYTFDEGFSVSFPSDWSQAERKNSFISSDKQGQIDITVMQRSSQYLNMPLADYAKIAFPAEVSVLPTSSSTERITTISGIIGYKTLWRNPAGQGPKINEETITYFGMPSGNSSQTIQISCWDQECKDIYDKVISTFKFTKQSVGSAPTNQPTNELNGWKIYSNGFNYWFSYPKDWILEEDSQPLDSASKRTKLQSKDFVTSEPAMGGGYTPGADSGILLQIKVSSNPNFKSFDELKTFNETKSTEFPLNYFSSTKDITIGGMPAVEKLGGKPYKGQQFYAYTFANGQIYEIYLTSNDNQQALFDQILSTFRFTQ